MSDELFVNSFIWASTRQNIQYDLWDQQKISLRILAVWSESSLIAWAFYSIRAIDEQEALLHWMGVQADLSICWSSKSYCRCRSLLKCLWWTIWDFLTVYVCGVWTISSILNSYTYSCCMPILIVDQRTKIFRISNTLRTFLLVAFCPAFQCNKQEGN